MIKKMLLILGITLIIVGCGAVGTKISISGNSLNISIKTFSERSAIDEGYFESKLYIIPPAHSMANYDYSGSLCIVMSEQELDKCEIGFSSGIYLADAQGVLIGVADQFVSENSARGYYMSFETDGEYSVTLNELPRDYAVKDVLYVGYCYYEEYKDGSSKADVTKVIRRVSEYNLYKLPIKDSIITNNSIVLIPDLAKLSSISLNSFDDSLALGWRLLFFLKTKTRRRDIKELYALFK
jgi:hypothetical protein